MFLGLRAFERGSRIPGCSIATMTLLGMISSDVKIGNTSWALNDHKGSPGIGRMNKGHPLQIIVSPGGSLVELVPFAVAT